MRAPTMGILIAALAGGLATAPAWAAPGRPATQVAAASGLDSEGWWRKGKAALDDGVPDLALTCFQRALALDPAKRVALVDLASVCTSLERWDDARTAFEKLLAATPGDAEALNGLGYVHYRQDRVEDAIACYRRAISRKPDPQYHLNLGLAYLAQGRHGEAETEFRRTLTLQPEHFWASNNLGYTLQQLGDLRGAAQAYEAALPLSQGRVTAHLNYGAMLLDAGDIPGAAYVYREGLKQDDRAAEVHLGLAMALSRMEWLNEAYLEARVAAGLAPDNAEARHVIAQVHEARGETARAIAAVREAIALAPDEPEYLLTLARLCWRDGQAEAGTVALERFLQLAPGDDRAVDLRWRVRLMRDQPQP